MLCVRILRNPSISRQIIIQSIPPCSAPLLHTKLPVRLFSPSAAAAASRGTAFPHFASRNWRPDDSGLISEEAGLSRYCLRKEDLQGLEVRSVPHPTLGPSSQLSLYRREDLFQKSLDVWGSEPALLAERERRAQEQRLLDERRRIKSEFRKAAVTPAATDWRVLVRQLPKTGGNAVVIVAASLSLVMTSSKLTVALITGSASLLAESFRSIVDLVNQGIYLAGVVLGTRKPSKAHPYGFSSSGYISALAASGLLLCGGGAFGMYSGFMSLISIASGSHGAGGLAEDSPLWLAGGIVGISLLAESYTLYRAVKEMRIASKRYGMSWREYVTDGPHSATASILAEDFVAVLGSLVAGFAIYSSAVTGSAVWDAVGGLTIGAMTMGVAGLNMSRNLKYLQNHAMPKRYIDRCVEILRNSPIVSQVYDVKAVAIGPETYRFKAEILLHSHAMTRICIDDLNMDDVAAKLAGTVDKQILTQFLFEYGDVFVRTLGDQIDEIETLIRTEMPEIKYVDLETI